MKNKKVGFWKGYGPENNQYPDVNDFVSPDWDSHLEREVVFLHLKNGRTIVSYKGVSTCRICNQNNGSADKTDGTYVWPEGLLHYIIKHKVKPPQEFIDHAMDIYVGV